MTWLTDTSSDLRLCVARTTVEMPMDGRRVYSRMFFWYGYTIRNGFFRFMCRLAIQPQMPLQRSTNDDGLQSTQSPCPATTSPERLHTASGTTTISPVPKHCTASVKSQSNLHALLFIDRSARQLAICRGNLEIKTNSISQEPPY